MQIVKGILIVIYFIVCLALIILAMVQSKEDAGLSSTITGTSSNNFFEKNKGNTKEGKQKRWTVILGIVLVLLCIILGAIYAI
jgi:preprotein translocase subunit SecG